MSTETKQNSPDNLFKTHWEVIDTSRTEMAKGISLLANSLSGPRAMQLNSVSRWLNGSKGYEAVLERPDVLCFCRPWLDALLAKTDQEPLSKFEMSAAIGVGYCKFENNAPVPRNLTPFLYPALAFLAWLAVMTFASVFVLPGFREMYQEFGIELPWLTRMVMSGGQLLQTLWFPLFALLLLVPFMLWVLLRFSQLGKAYSLNWLDRRFAKFRSQLSIWASHVASLLAVGVDQQEAIQIAGRCSPNKNLQSLCNTFTKNANDSLLDPDAYPLINNSLLLTSKAAKIAILEECARYYRSVSGIVQSWWLSWLSKAILVMIAATLLIAVISMFLPMLSIVSGLTG